MKMSYGEFLKRPGIEGNLFNIAEGVSQAFAEVGVRDYTQRQISQSAAPKWRVIRDVDAFLRLLSDGLVETLLILTDEYAMCRNDDPIESTTTEQASEIRRTVDGAYIDTDSEQPTTDATEAGAYTDTVSELTSTETRTANDSHYFNADGQFTDPVDHHDETINRTPGARTVGGGARSTTTTHTPGTATHNHGQRERTDTIPARTSTTKKTPTAIDLAERRKEYRDSAYIKLLNVIEFALNYC